MTHIHLIGIGGAGMSAIATVLLQRGQTVSGSDQHESTNTRRLAEQGATIYIGQDAENLTKSVDIVVISSAIPAQNPELQAAQRRKLPIYKRDRWLGHMMDGTHGIAVAGTHGKTTTTAMIAYLLQGAGLSPSYIIGGYVPQLQGNAQAGQGKAFVVEADEYDHMFLGLRPHTAVLTTVEWDHPDIFPTPTDTDHAFIDFVQKIVPNGQLIICGNDAGARRIAQTSHVPVTSYGLGDDNDWPISDLSPNRFGGYDFSLHVGPLSKHRVSLRVPGQHNVLNAVAALIVANQQGVALPEAVPLIDKFRGVNRRFEQKGSVNGIDIFDDYAHHPTEVRATLQAARTRFEGRRIWAVFQPHTFSRTAALLNDFTTAFKFADRVILLDIFASREKDDGSISSATLLETVEHPRASHQPQLADAVDYLADHVVEGDVVLTLGAGDGYLVGEWLLERLS